MTLAVLVPRSTSKSMTADFRQKEFVHLKTRTTKGRPVYHQHCSVPGDWHQVLTRRFHLGLFWVSKLTTGARLAISGEFRLAICQ